MRLFLILTVFLIAFGTLSAIPIGDTLTVIITPLPNLPVIVLPGEDIFIYCKAAASTSNWHAQLQRGSIVVPLDLSFSVYDAALQRWRLCAPAPTPDLYEIYDLKVTASNGISDVAKHCVEIIPQRRNNYFFVHITDAHMPTTEYSYEGGASDSTSMVDMRKVVDDINLIHPEFVLFTGDLVNEGECEDYLTMRSYTRAQKILNDIDVPVYVVAGNHDLGGWTSTPPSDGTARRNWWRFFGWRYLQSPPASLPARTQDYSFDYGQVHYIGLEAYDNYDEWMYSTYGDTSFRNQQIDWLQDDIEQVPGSSKIILFYHYDFANQINLSSLGADGALYGHGHQNQGSVSSVPFNLETDNICNNTRAYRPVRIDGTTITPKNTLYAGDDGGNLEVNFYPANNGAADSVMAVVENHQSVTFDNARVKFKMPDNGHGFAVHNGTLTQVDRSGPYAICYVTFNLSANNTRSVSVAIDESSASDPVAPPVFGLNCYPNPFRDVTTIRFEAPGNRPADVTVYNLKGQLIRTWTGNPTPVTWDGRDRDGVRVAPGVYLVRAGDGTSSTVRRLLLTR
jgi:3',5'-cyclic AMP phosphodiesterase CpdA